MILVSFSGKMTALYALFSLAIISLGVSAISLGEESAILRQLLQDYYDRPAKRQPTELDHTGNSIGMCSSAK